jgi:hypothetical protein
MAYKVNSNNITLTNGYSLDFEYPIKETLVIGDIIVIVVESPFDVSYEKNVFAIKQSGDFLWRINDVKLGYTGSDNCFYVGVELNKNNELVLFNWCDTAVIVNPHTGQMIRTYQTK